jgi:hypothetical protein
MFYEIIAGLSVYSAGLASGVVIAYQSARPPTDEQIHRYMNKIVNQEEVEYHQRLLRLQLMRAGRKTTRFDGGPNAKIMRMSIRPRRRR